MDYQQPLPIVHKHKKILGYTLIEVVISIVVFGIIMLSVVTIFQQFSLNYNAQKNLGQIHDQSFVQFSQMTREIRGMQSLTSIAATAVRFVNADGVDITYQLTGVNIVRVDNTNASSQILISSISSLAFTFFNISGASTAVIANIVYINMDIGVSFPGGSYNFVTTVYKRR